MRVLLVNGSPNKEGCTYTALCEVASALNAEGIETEFFHIGKKPIAGCLGCQKCSLYVMHNIKPVIKGK